MGWKYSPNGRNARNVWQIPTQGRPEAHFATFPDELPRRCILAGTSEHGVCADCGAPWARQTETTRPERSTYTPNQHVGIATLTGGNAQLPMGQYSRSNCRLATRLRMRTVRISSAAVGSTAVRWPH